MMTINEQMKDVVSGTKTAKEIVAEGVSEYAITYFSTKYETKEMADAFRAIKAEYVLIQAAPEAPVAIKSEETVICDCGHSCAKSLVMTASFGTSCPNCYDRVSV